MLASKRIRWTLLAVGSAVLTAGVVFAWSQRVETMQFENGSQYRSGCAGERPSARGTQLRVYGLEPKASLRRTGDDLEFCVLPARKRPVFKSHEDLIAGTAAFGAQAMCQEAALA